MEMRASEHLGKMLERIKQTHWGKGSFLINKGEHPTFCLLGLMHWTAVGDSAIEDFDSGDAEFEFDDLYSAHAYLRQVLDDEPMPVELWDEESTDNTWDDDIVEFNDAAITTREDVARVVEKAMVLAKESGD